MGGLDEMEAEGAVGRRRARLEALFREHADAVLSYAVRRTDPEAAKDVLAETFATAWRRIEDVPDPALPWLLGVARRVLANHRRSSRRAEALGVRVGFESTPAPADPADVVDARSSARVALERLPAAERETVELLAWEGLSPAEAARVLGCTKSAVALRLHRARKRLAPLLAAADEQTEEVEEIR